jgi:hypothetical protein
MSHGKTFLLRVSASDLAGSRSETRVNSSLQRFSRNRAQGTRALTIILHLHAVSKGFSAKRLLKADFGPCLGLKVSWVLRSKV